MNQNFIIDNEFENNFAKVVNDIVKLDGLEKSARNNSENELTRNFKALIDNFEKAKNLPRECETLAQQISKFCAAAKAKLKLNDLVAMHNIKILAGLDFDVELSQLMTYFTYFWQSIDYIESLSPDMRARALEQRGEILDTFCAAIKLDGILFKNFCHIINGKWSKTFAGKLDERLHKFLLYAVGVYILQMFFIVEQFSFLAEYYCKNGNLTKYNEYSKNAHLIFKQMKSQLAGKKNLIDEVPPFTGTGSALLATWQKVLIEANFPDICERTGKFGTACHENEDNALQLSTLHIAACQADFEIIEAALQKNLNDLNTADQEGFTPLHFALLADKSVVEYLLQNESINVNAQSKAGLTALHIAVIKNSTEIVKMLLKSPKIDVNLASIGAWTALHMAVALRRVEIVAELLKEEKLQINAKIFGQLSALHIAVILDEADLIRMLLEKGAEVDTISEAGLTAHQLAEKFCCSNALEILEDFKQKPLKETPAVAPLLHQSTVESPTCLAKIPTEDLELEEKQQRQISKTDTNTEISTETTAILQANSKIAETSLLTLDTEAGDDLTIQLFQAVLKGEPESIKALVAKGADLTKTHASGKNVLDFAVMSGNLQVLQYLLEECNLGASKTDACLRDLLFNAAELGSFDILKYFIEEKGLNPHLKSTKNKTLLCAAVVGGNEEIIAYLIDDQSLPIISTPENCPLYAAIEINNLKLIKYFLDRDLSILGVSDERRPILAAAQKSSLEVFKYLLERGASIDVKINGSGVFDYAAIAGNLPVLKFLVAEKNFKLETTIVESGLSTLFQFARVGSLEDIKYFVEEQKLDMHRKGPRNGTILHEAAFNRNLDVIKYFVEDQSLDVKARDNNGFVPLFYAAQQNNLAAVKYFVSDRSMGIYLKDKRNRSILHIAAMNGQLDVVRYLVEEQKADVNAKDNDGLMPLFLCPLISQSADLIKYLLNRVSNVNGTSAYYENISHFAARIGNVDILKILVNEKGFKINPTENCGRTLLVDAVSQGKLEAVKYLVNDIKLDINAGDQLQRSALHIAAMNGHLDIVQFLIKEQGADVNVKDKDGLTPLFLCFEHSKNEDLIKYLLNRGSDVAGTRNDENILHLAAGMGNVDILKILVDERGMQTNVKHCLYGTPLFYAVQAGKLEAVKYFLYSKGVDVNARRWCDETPIFDAVHANNLDMVKLLVEHGARTNARESRLGHYPISYAEGAVKEYLMGKR